MVAFFSAQAKLTHYRWSRSMHILDPSRPFKNCPSYESRGSPIRLRFAKGAYPADTVETGLAAKRDSFFLPPSPCRICQRGHAPNARLIPAVSPCPATPDAPHATPAAACLRWPAIQSGAGFRCNVSRLALRLALTRLSATSPRANNAGMATGANPSGLERTCYYF